MAGRMMDERRGNIVLTVFCRDCMMSATRRRGRLGHVWANSQGGVSWETYDRKGKRGWLGGVSLAHPAFPDWPPPETLDACCSNHHGFGYVSTADVLAAYRRTARSRRGNIVLALRSTAP